MTRDTKYCHFGVPRSFGELGINKLLPKKKRILDKDRLTMESNLIKASALKLLHLFTSQIN